MTTPDSSPQEKAAPADAARPPQPVGQPKVTASTNEGAAASTSASAAAAGTSLKAGLVLVLVLLLLLTAGAGYLIKHNEPVARQLLSWNVQLPAWLLPPSLSQSGSDPATGSAALSGSSGSTAARTSPSSNSSTLGSDPSSTTGSASADTSGPVSGVGVGSGQVASPPPSAPVASLPPAPIRPSPQLDPAFRSALNGIDQLARGLFALPAGPQKPSLPKAQTPRPSGSLLAGAETPASQATAVEGSNQAPADPAQPQSMTAAPAMLEPGVFEKSLDFLSSLVRVQSVQGPEFAAHSQAFYQLVGQQMQAQLAAARLALLLGEVSLALRELSQTETLLDRHFDKTDPKVFQLQAEFAGLKRQVESLQ